MLPAMRIGLFSDCEGNAAALESILTALQAHAPDLLVCAGDVLCCPSSPDPPAETVALLQGPRRPGDPGEPRPLPAGLGHPALGAHAVDAPPPLRPRGHVLEDLAAAQARIRPADLAWLRALPEERVLDGGRVYVCHGMPGNPWNSIWPRHPVYDGNVSEADREASLRVLARAAAASGRPAEVVLCGHTESPGSTTTGSPTAARSAWSAGATPGCKVWRRSGQWKAR